MQPENGLFKMAGVIGKRALPSSLRKEEYPPNQKLNKGLFELTRTYNNTSKVLKDQMKLIEDMTLKGDKKFAKILEDMKSGKAAKVTEKVNSGKKLSRGDMQYLADYVQTATSAMTEVGMDISVDVQDQLADKIAKAQDKTASAKDRKEAFDELKEFLKNKEIKDALLSSAEDQKGIKKTLGLIQKTEVSASDVAHGKLEEVSESLIKIQESSKDAKIVGSLDNLRKTMGTGFLNFDELAEEIKKTSRKPSFSTSGSVSEKLSGSVQGAKKLGSQALLSALGLHGLDALFDISGKVSQMSLPFGKKEGEAKEDKEAKRLSKKTLRVQKRLAKDMEKAAKSQGNASSGFIKSLKSNTKAMGRTLTSSATNMAKSLGARGPMFLALIAIAAAFYFLRDIIRDKVKELVNWFSNTFPMFFDEIAGFINSIVDKISTVVNYVTEKVKSIKSWLGFGGDDEESSSESGGSGGISGEDVKNATGQVMEQVAVTGAKSLTKAALKKIPGVGLAVGTGLALDRASKGDYVGAALEFFSGAASMIPGVGTVASIGMDAILAGRDIANSSETTPVKKIEIKENLGKPQQQSPQVVPVPTPTGGQQGQRPAPASKGVDHKGLDFVALDQMG